MPWKCPACGIQIRHSEGEVMPRPGVVYRCHVCRLELILDLATDEFTVAPLPADPSEKKHP
jgi:rubredoxin